MVVRYLPAAAHLPASNEGRPSDSSFMSVSMTDTDTTTVDESVITGIPPRVGLAVSKAVGGSVVRHRVARKLRHVVAVHVEQLPDGCSMVIRALPAAATATSSELVDDFVVLMSRVTPCC